MRAFRHPNELDGDFWQHARDILPVWDDSSLAGDDLEKRQAGKAYPILSVEQEGREIYRSVPANIEPLTSAGIRVPLGELVAEARSGFADGLAELAESDDSRDELVERARIYAADKRGGRGRKGLPVEHYEEVARVYREEYATAEERPTPTKAVRKHFSIGKSSAAKKVARARELGLLGPARPGRAGEGETRS
jgi:hypothetical protein